MAHPFGALLGQYVPPMGGITFEGSGGVALEALCRPAIGLDLWHLSLTPLFGFSMRLDSPLFLFGAQDHYHLPPFHLRLLLHGADLGQVGFDALEQLQSQLAVRVLAPTKPHGDLGLVPFG